MDEYLYDGREQSQVKHLILQRYLLQVALIIGRTWPSITYVDCFSGPWKSKSESFEDTSFSIAIQQLRKARDRLAEDGINVQLRAFFIEQNTKSFSMLKDYMNEIDDIEIELRNAELENSVDEICSFVNAAPTKTFPFVFVDPKGWTGFALDVIRPLLRLSPCEVLINFMTQHIVRFVNHEESQQSFERLFGSNDFSKRLEGTFQENRVDAAVNQYLEIVTDVGSFEFPGVAGILNPLKDRSHFHLLYLSRHGKGLEVFKKAEKKSMDDMETVRAKAEKQHRESRSNQLELFAPDSAPPSEYYLALRKRYIDLAQRKIEEMIETHGRIKYDDAWKSWLRSPMVWESDLKDWIKNSPNIVVEGLGPKERVAKRNHSHFLSTTKSNS